MRDLRQARVGTEAIAMAMMTMMTMMTMMIMMIMGGLSTRDLAANLVGQRASAETR